MTNSMHIANLLVLMTACGFPKPADVAGDGGPSDSPTGLVVHVSPSGDDANDGLVQPVKTLKHGLGIAAANTQVTTVVLASGSYSASSGETFPYTVPPNVTIAGPAGGGAILAGPKTGPGITVDAGGLQDLDLQDFDVAVIVTGTTSLKNIRILNSPLAVRAETTGRLTVNNLDIMGTAGACQTGIVLLGAAQLMATTLTSRNLGSLLDSRDQSAASIANATVMGDNACIQAVVLIKSSAMFSVSDSLLDGGGGGLIITPTSSSFQATITNTTLRNFKDGALSGTSPPSGPFSFQMTGGELSNNGGPGQLILGIWKFMNVSIRQNPFAFYLQEGELIMRGCMIIGNGIGINVSDNARADFGTVESPGNNIIQNNTDIGLTIDGSNGLTRIDAVGNTWNPNVQGADATGKYATPTVVSGPVATVRGNNYAIASGWSLYR